MPPMNVDPARTVSADPLRRCLELQLDALLLAIIAAASEAADPVPPPWDRWGTEDVQMACALAAEVIGGGQSLPALPRRSLDQAFSATTTQDLAERYESMAALLTEVLDVCDDESTTSPERPLVSRALDHCRRRLTELHEERAKRASRRTIDLDDRSPRYLPGELLG